MLLHSLLLYPPPLLPALRSHPIYAQEESSIGSAANRSFASRQLSRGNKELDFPSGFEVDGLPVEEAYFRGRKLDGVTVPLPDGYSGYVVGKKKSKSVEDSNGGENSWDTLAKCSNMTFWNHDSLPSKDDPSMRMFHLFAVAKALHEPLKVEDLPSIK